METREIILKSVSQDLMGPLDEREILDDYPTDVYLTGILWPQDVKIDEPDDNFSENLDDTIDDSPIKVLNFRPSSCGISFAVKPDDDGIAYLKIIFSAGRYVRLIEDEFLFKRWQRVPIKREIDVMVSTQNAETLNLDHEMEGCAFQTRAKKSGGGLLITIIFINNNERSGGARDDTEEKSIFQCCFEVRTIGEVAFIPKTTSNFGDINDNEVISNNLLFRGCHQYAVGHTCSAGWEEEDGQVTLVKTSWIPHYEVKRANSSGSAHFSQFDAINSPFDVSALASTTDEDMLKRLSGLPTAYRKWIIDEQSKLNAVPDNLKQIAKSHIDKCNEAEARISEGIKFLRDDENARIAFRLANKAMSIQSQWKKPIDRKDEKLFWRPFQLAFVLLSLRSSAISNDPNRDVMDLLWFPTGGGKTEAYLLLSAFVIFYRRLSLKGAERSGGVTVFMRYTLRLLTIQQFQRAASMIFACELLRVEENKNYNNCLGLEKIGIGLWVGDASTPNKVKVAAEGLNNPNGKASPKQLSTCPSCKQDLKWWHDEKANQIKAACENEHCSLGKKFESLPIYTVDEDIYSNLPTLLIATSDKFAQIVRARESGKLFGQGVSFDTPSLIIQDELHLISGPLGTLAGLYECAVEYLCKSKNDGSIIKIVGSSATIRRSEQQVKGLFNRRSSLFPPSGIDHNDSGFSIEDTSNPGRLYLGVTSAGRSANFMLQGLCASILQSSNREDIDDKSRDDYWTLVNYFNNLRELGGALVLMQDSVPRSMELFAKRREENSRIREAKNNIELTSRIDSSSIPQLFERLALKDSSGEAIDIVLASNMISVGIDVDRLAAMCVMGQPKGIAEYIQATSRVGRSNVPGLVYTVYNSNKVRDRARYESFCSWHQRLYSEVEATSVTPFAPRARDKALHAALVAIARHTIDGMNQENFDASEHEDELYVIKDFIVERAEMIDKDEAKDVEIELTKKIHKWMNMGPLKKYWDDDKDEGLMISAEKAAEQSAVKNRKSRAWVTPNSLRTVEPSVCFTLKSSGDDE